MVRTLTGSWSAAELPHRVSQMFVEDVLRAEAAACPTVSIRPGWRMTAVRDTGGGVEVDAEHDGGRTTLRAAYAMGADGGSSPTRKALGYGYVGESGVVRDFMGGRMFAIHFRSAKLYDVIPHPRAWMYWAVNRDRRAFMATVNGRDEFNFHTQLKPGQSAEQITDAQAKAMFEEALAAPLDIEIIARSSWTAGYTLVAEKFQRGRIFLGGDAVHLFTPAGGLGYNTAVEDAVNLGWKLNAVLKGWGGPALLDTYEIERQAIAKRNTAYARGFADSLGLFVPPPELEDEGPAGEAARKLTGDHFNHHARFEFNIPGITFGGRYDGSPIVVPDGTAPPPDAPNSYQPTACPGRPRAASVARRRPVALRHARLRVHAAGAWREACRHRAVPRGRRGAEHAAVDRARPRRRSARSLRSRSGADPARPDRGLARQFGGGRDGVLRRAAGHLDNRLISVLVSDPRRASICASPLRAARGSGSTAALASARVAVGQVRYSSSPVS